MKRYCEICGKEIERPLLKYCLECRDKGYKKKKIEYRENKSVPCIDCGKPCTKLRCHACNSKFQGKRMGNKRFKRKCKICGVQIPNARFNKRYCDVCYKWRRTQRKHTKICQNCGKSCNGKYCKECSYLIRYGKRIEIKRFVAHKIKVIGNV